MSENAERVAPLTEKQAQVLAALRDHRVAAVTAKAGHDNHYMSLDAVAGAVGTSRRGAANVLAALERLNLVLRWEPMGRAYPRFTAFPDVQHNDGGQSS